MRLWHKDLIPALPRQQLLGQWRECCLIAKNIAEEGTPNHLLVNKIMDYPITHFWTYCEEVRNEMERRGYECDFSKIEQWFECWMPEPYMIIDCKDIFIDWHNDRYLVQCFHNLQEKFDCGGIPRKEFVRLYKRYCKLHYLEER